MVTIHKDVWGKIRAYLIESVVLFAAFLITIGLYKIESTIIAFIFNVDINVFVYILINIYTLSVVYHFLSFIRKALSITVPEPLKWLS